ncbi:MAG: response regulator [Candidatus Omnitrophota bacterium]|nr:response regulator [Candidatus Omnitrophota bacterium]
MDKKNKGVKVLIVDDEEIVREVLSYAIKGRGFIIEDARNGREALEKVAQGRPDIIILDVAMPEMDGLQVCKQLRENPYTRNIPIIFLSAQRDIDKFIQGMPGAAIKYIAKPCDIEYLLKQIDNCATDKNPLT